MRLKTRSPDRYKIAHLSPRNPHFKMESWWDVLPPELKEKIFARKPWAEHRDTMKALVEEIGKFCLQPLPEDDHQGDSTLFLAIFFLLEKLAICPVSSNAVITATNWPSRHYHGLLRCSRGHWKHKIGNRKVHYFPDLRRCPGCGQFFCSCLN